MKKERITYLLSLILISTAYLVGSVWLQARGYYSLEAYFFDYKSEVITKYDSGFIRSFYFTQPAFLFLISLPFSFFGKIKGIYIINALLIGGLTNHLIFKSLAGNLIQKTFFFYLLFSPIILFAATSGGSLAAYLLLHFLFFSLLVKYTKSLSVFHLTLLSLVIGVYVLMDQIFVKLILVIIPIFFFSGFYKAKGISGNFFYKASVIFRNNSQRRKFFSGFFASVFVLAFIPLMTYLIFLVINKVFAGDYYFYKKSLGDSWSGYSSLFPLIDEVPKIWDVLSESSLFHFIAIFLVGTTSFFSLFQYGNMKSTRMVLILISLFVLAEVTTSEAANLNLVHLSLLTAAGLASIFYSESTKVTLKLRSRLIPFLIPFMAVIFEYYYFENSIVKSERFFFEVVHAPKQAAEMKSILNSTLQLNEASHGHILVDDAIFYPELVGLDSDFTWEGHFSPQFLSALQEPALYADYLIVTKPSHPLHLNDIVAVALKRLESFDAKPSYQILYEDELIQVLSLDK
jgi:hypothetical protein